MFFVRMIRLVPMVAILLFVGLVIYLIAQAKYSPNKAKSIIIKFFIWICGILTLFFLLACLYAILDKNIPVLELFASFAAVPAFGLLITLICRAIFLHHYPEFKDKALKTNRNESFTEFWKKRLKKALKDIINKKIPRP